MGRQRHQRARVGRGLLPALRLGLDPTPGRGQLGATYLPSSGEFNFVDAADIGLAEPLSGLNPALQEGFRTARRGRAARSPRSELGRRRLRGARPHVRDRPRPSSSSPAPSWPSSPPRLSGAARGSQRDPRELASACRKDVVGYLADQGIEISPSATLPEIGDTLSSATTRQRRAARPRPHARPLRASSVAPRASAGLRRELREVRRGLRRRLGVISRVKGAASLRSLASRSAESGRPAVGRPCRFA